MKRKVDMGKANVTGGTDGLYTVDGESVYCADLLESLSGSVGVIEIGGDAGNGKNLQPGYEGNAVYNAVRDGEMFTVHKRMGLNQQAGIIGIGLCVPAGKSGQANIVMPPSQG